MNNPIQKLLLELGRDEEGMRDFLFMMFEKHGDAPPDLESLELFEEAHYVPDFLQESFADLLLCTADGRWIYLLADMGRELECPELKPFILMRLAQEVEQEVEEKHGTLTQPLIVMIITNGGEGWEIED